MEYLTSFSLRVNKINLLLFLFLSEMLFIKILSWIFLSFAFRENVNANIIFVVPSVHQCKSLPNYDGLSFWEPQKQKHWHLII